MIWDSQEGQGEAFSAAERAERKSEQTAAELRALQRQVDRMALACQAMWEIIRENSDFKEEDLDAKMAEIDARDGKNDGTIGALVLTCPACGHKTNSKRPTCVICGAPVASPHRFGG
jgi:hypothetical protein